MIQGGDFTRGDGTGGRSSSAPGCGIRPASGDRDRCPVGGQAGAQFCTRCRHKHAGESPALLSPAAVGGGRL